MLFSKINPNIRFVSYLLLDEGRGYAERVALDARIFYVSEGEGKIKIGENIQYEMPEHSLIVINSGIPYQILPPKHSVKYIQINFDFTKNAASVSEPVRPLLTKDFTKRKLLDPCEFEDVPILSKVLYIKDFTSIEKKMLSIINEYDLMLLYSKQKAEYVLGECLVECARFVALGEIVKENTKYSKILLYIREHYAEKLTNELIGAYFGYHPNYISFLVKQSTGLSLHNYIIKVRLEKAVSLLISTELSIDNIAATCGFYDAAYFNKLFKKHFNVNPSKYRSI